MQVLLDQVNIEFQLMIKILIRKICEFHLQELEIIEIVQMKLKRLVCRCLNCGISSKMATKAVQTVCKALYNHEFYITKEEAIAKDPQLISYRESEETN